MEGKAPETSRDLSSVLNHVTALEREREALQNSLKEQNLKLEKLTASKREEMKKQLDTMISEWINQIDVHDEKQKEQFMQGMHKMVQETKEDSPVWQVMCCASAAHKRNVTNLQQIKEEYDALKTKIEGGNFAHEDARMTGSKRKEPEAPSRSGNVWDEFEDMCKHGALSTYVPDEADIRKLRSEWKPL